MNSGYTRIVKIPYGRYSAPELRSFKFFHPIEKDADNLRALFGEIAVKDTMEGSPWMYGMIVVPILTGCTIEDWIKYFVSE